MVAFTILAGGYDVFVATYLFNAATCSLSLLSKSPTGPSPSWITLDPTNSSILYAVNEVATGALQSFEINANGTLSGAIDTVLTGGSSPAFTTGLSTGEVAAPNYFGGNARIIPTTSALYFVNNSAPEITFPLTSTSPTAASHPHMALEYNDEVFIPDLGGDTIWRLGNVGIPGNYAIHGSIPQPTGSGPRHIAIYNERLFTLHELSSTLTVQEIPPAPNGTSTIIASALITPPNPPQGALFAAAEILIPTPTERFRIPYIYVSNRNTGTQDPRGDTIAIFEHVFQGTPFESLRLVRQVYTGLDQIRGMEIGPVDERGGDEYLIASGFAGTAGVIVFRRIEGGRNLELVARNLEIPTRTSFVWL